MADVVALTVPIADGDRLKKARRVQGLKRSAVAAHVGATKESVRRWEAGGCEIPVRQAAALSELFGISVPYLLGQVG